MYISHLHVHAIVFNVPQQVRHMHIHLSNVSMCMASMSMCMSSMSMSMCMHSGMDRDTCTHVLVHRYGLDDNRGAAHRQAVERVP